MVKFLNTVFIAINSIHEYQLVHTIFYCILITQVELMTQNLCTSTVKCCYQAHSKNIYSLVKDFLGTINFSNYT